MNLSSNKKQSFINLKDRIYERIKTARQRIGMKQSELAEAGEVGRTTQLAYENDVTEPTTAYLRRVQGTGLDIPFILFGVPADELFAEARTNAIDWKLLQQSYEDVEFFCIRFAPNCPPSYRWELVSDIYSLMRKRSELTNDQTSTFDSMSALKSIWDKK